MRKLRQSCLRACAGLLLVVGLMAGTASSATAAPQQGFNNWNCQPADGKNPIVLVHGLGGQQFSNWVYLGPRLASDGYCVYSFTWGSTVFGELAGGMTSLRDGAVELADFVESVQGSTGADTVTLVGHSAGTMTSAYYLKFLGGDGSVDHFFAIAGVFDGTTLNGLDALVRAAVAGLPITAEAFRQACTSCLEFIKPSDFIDDLNAGGLTVPDVQYTAIITRLDYIVTPYTSGAVPAGPNSRTIVAQQRCAADFSGHGSIAYNPNTANRIIETLEPGRTFRCVPFFAPV